ncbi:MAG: hypothetical protein WD771_07845 [Gemmatimonadaceae bacterium]
MLGRVLPLALASFLGAPSAAAAQTTVDGVIFASYRYGLQKDTTYSPPAAQSNFEVDRAYLNVRSRMDGGVTTRLTIDVDGREAAANQLTFRLKYAYVAWTPEASALTYRFGMQPTPQVGWEDDLWGYRFQGPNPLDRAKYLSSSDIGAAVEGSWGAQRVNLEAGVYNGETYSGAPGDNRKDFAARLSVRVLETANTSRTGGLRLTGFALVGQATGGTARTRTVGMVSYQTTSLLLGAQVALTQDSTDASARTKGRMMSLFGTLEIPDGPFGLMGRLDRWDPDTDLNPAAGTPAASEQTRVIGGISYRLARNVKLLLDGDVVLLQNDPGNNAFQAANRSIYVHAEIKY